MANEPEDLNADSEQEIDDAALEMAAGGLIKNATSSTNYTYNQTIYFKGDTSGYH